MKKLFFALAMVLVLSGCGGGYNGHDHDYEGTYEHTASTSQAHSHINEIGTVGNRQILIESSQGHPGQGSDQEILETITWVVSTNIGINHLVGGIGGRFVGTHVIRNYRGDYEGDHEVTRAHRLAVEVADVILYNVEGKSPWFIELMEEMGKVRGVDYFYVGTDIDDMKQAIVDILTSLSPDNEQYFRDNALALL